MKLMDKLTWILNSLKGLDEDNFETNFPLIVNSMIASRDVISDLEKDGFFIKNPEQQKKVEEITKLISEEYDNRINFWEKKLSEISEMLISSRNEQKILSYKR